MTRLRRFAGSRREEELQEREGNRAEAERVQAEADAARRRLAELQGKIPDASAPPRRR